MSEPSPRTAADVVVIGGGAIGLAVAWRAAGQGRRVLVLERDRAGAGASHVAAGMIAPIAEARPAEAPLLELGLRSAQLFGGFVRELETATGHDVGYTACGTLLVARDEDEARSLERELELRERFGLAATRLRPSAARRLEPALTPALRLALEIPDDHAVDPRRLTGALVAAVRSAGGEVREGTHRDRRLDLPRPRRGGLDRRWRRHPGGSGGGRGRPVDGGAGAPDADPVPSRQGPDPAPARSRRAGPADPRGADGLVVCRPARRRPLRDRRDLRGARL